MYEVTSELSRVNFNPSHVEAVLQNVKMCLITYLGTVPLFREFGFDSSVIDRPLSVARALITASVYDVIGRYEPRFDVQEVRFDHRESVNGKMIVTVVGDIR